jgi:hypothetical protein
MGAELFHADGRIDKHDENKGFSRNSAQQVYKKDILNPVQINYLVRIVPYNKQAKGIVPVFRLALRLDVMWTDGGTVLRILFLVTRWR